MSMLLQELVIRNIKQARRELRLPYRSYYEVLRAWRPARHDVASMHDIYGHSARKLSCASPRLNSEDE